MPLIIAHRGASYDAPENTLAAFAEAWQQQADGVEGDYCYTLDRQVVCIHDADTHRTGGQNLKVSESNLSQLRQLDYGLWKSPRFEGQTLPLLSDVLQLQPKGKWLVLELKSGPEIVPLVAEQLHRSGGNLEQTLIIAFDDQTIAAAKKLLPRVKAHWLTDFRLDRDGIWQPSPAEVVKHLRSCQADGLGAHANPAAVTAEFVDRLSSKGYGEFHLWTVDDVNQAEYFSRLGAWGLTTNRPGWLRGQLGDRLPRPVAT